jgi:hypothetical protein
MPDDDVELDVRASDTLGLSSFRPLDGESAEKRW